MSSRPPVVSSVPKGIAFARYARSLLVANGDPVSAHAFAQGQAWNDTPSVALALKAAVNPADTGTLADSLAFPLAYDFAELLRPMTVLGRLQGQRRVPFATRTLVQAGGAAAAWVGEGKPVPVVAADFDKGTTLVHARVASISVVTQELVRSSAPGVDVVLSGDLARAAALAADGAFLDPANAGVPGVKPASVTHGASAIPSSGTTVEAIDNDLRAAIGVLTDAEIDLGTAAWVMRPSAATYLATLRGTGGAPAYPGMSARGGVLLGLPVLTSNAIESPAAGSPSGSFLALVAAGEVLVADDGEASVEVSEAAALEMDTAPAGGAQQMVSLWQSGLAGLKATRVVNWQRRRSEAVATVSGINY